VAEQIIVNIIVMKSIILDAIKCALGSVRSDCSILQIGPDIETTEYVVIPEHVEHNVNIFDLYNSSPYLFEYNIGKVVQDNKVLYDSDSFDFVVIHAQSSLVHSNLFNEALRIVRNNGAILVFVKIRRIKPVIRLFDFCLDESFALHEINALDLSIQEITSLSLTDSHFFHCFMLMKNRGMFVA